MGEPTEDQLADSDKVARKLLARILWEDMKWRGSFPACLLVC
jgi:hypothetical protein